MYFYFDKKSFIQAFSILISLIFIPYFPVDANFSDTTYINDLNRKSIHFCKKDSNSAITFAKKALELSEKMNYHFGITSSYRNLGECYLINNDYKLALHYNNKYLEASFLLSDKSEIIRALKQVGYIRNILGDFGESLKIYQELLEISVEMNDLRLKSLTMGNIGCILAELKDTCAFDYYREALDISMKLDEDNLIVWLSDNLACIYTNIERNFIAALDYYEIAEKYFSKLEDKANYAYIFRHKGETYLEMNNFDLAKYYLDKAINFHEDANIDYEIALDFLSIGEYYEKRRDTLLAINYFKRGIEIGKRLNSTPLLVDLYENLFEISVYFKINPDTIMNYFHSYISAKDSPYNKETRKQVTSLEIKYDLEKKNKEIIILTNKQRFSRIRNLVVTLVLLLSFVLIYFRLRARIKRSKIEKINLQKELHVKNKNLTSKAMQLAKNSELMSNIRKKLSSSITHFKKENRKMIEEVICQLKFETNSNIWMEFEKMFSQTYEDFFKNINKIYPNITLNEKRLCALTKLNLSTKEIAAITHQTTMAIQVARTRLRKKMNIDHIDISLYNFLENL